MNIHRADTLLRVVTGVLVIVWCALHGAPAFAQPTPTWCVVQKGDYSPQRGPENPAEMFSVMRAPALDGGPWSIVQCYSTVEAARLALDQLLTATAGIGDGGYSSICEANWDIYARMQGPAGDLAAYGPLAVMKNTGQGAPPGYVLSRTNLCCDVAMGVAGKHDGGCGCWSLTSVPVTVCRGPGARMYSATGTTEWLPTTPPTPIPPLPGVTPKTPPGAGCFAADPGAGGMDAKAHYDWAAKQDTVTLANNLSYKIGLLFNCSSPTEGTLSAIFADISVLLTAYRMDPSCFGGDVGVLNTNWEDHYDAFRGRKDRRNLLRDNLSWKLASAIKCLQRDRSSQLSLFANASTKIAAGAPPAQAGGGTTDGTVPPPPPKRDGTTGSGSGGSKGTTDPKTDTGRDKPAKGAWVLQPATVNSKGAALQLGETSISYSYAKGQWGPMSNTLTWSQPPATLQEGQELTLQVAVGHFSDWKPTRYGFEAGSIMGSWNARCFASPGDTSGGGRAWGGVISADSGVRDKNSMSRTIVFAPGSATGERMDECYLQINAGAPCSDSCGDYSAQITYQYKRRDAGK